MDCRIESTTNSKLQELINKYGQQEGLTRFIKQIVNPTAMTFDGIKADKETMGLKFLYFYDRESANASLKSIKHDLGDKYATLVNGKDLRGREMFKIVVTNPDSLSITNELAGVGYVKDGVEELFDNNPELANAVYEAMGLSTINESEITYTDEDGKPCAKMGGRSAKFTKGSKWEVVKDLKGYPSHAQGGVDIKLGKDGFSFTRGNGQIMAAHGLVLPAIKAANGLVVDGDDDSILPNFDKIKSTLNPKNWGVTDYSDKGDFDTAYSAARKAGEKEFMWNNQRFNTQNSGTASQQFNMYGNVNSLITSKADDKTKEKIIKTSFVGNNMNAENLERQFALNSLAGTPSYKHTAVHPDQEEAYAKFKNQPLEKSRKEIMDEYRKISTGKIRPRYNAFTNTIYGNSNIAETAHAYRDTEKSEILSFIKDYIKYPFFSKKEQLADYTNRDHFEFDTHIIVEPILKSYLNGEIEKEDIPIYIKNLREHNNEYLLDKNNPKHTFDIKDLELYYPYNDKSNKYKIQKLQKALSNRGYKLPESTKKDGSFDGIWGDETKNALLDYQTKNKKK